MVRDGALDPEPIEGVPAVYASGQGGLLDVALDPDFDSNRLVYLSYAAPGDDGNSTRVARARLGDGRLEDLEGDLHRRAARATRANTSARVWRSTLRAICSSPSASAGRAIARRIWARTTAR